MDSVSEQARREIVIEALGRYWRDHSNLVLDLPIACSRKFSAGSLPPKGIFISLPDWACDTLGIFVPEHLLHGSGVWEEVPWLDVVYWYLFGVAEAAYEDRNGPILSYSNRLRGWDSRFWEKAWVNRIALFLRKWAAQDKGIDEVELFGPIPPAEVLLTHDVDAISKTFAIRLKQTGQNVFKVFRSLRARQWYLAFRRMKRSLSFLFGSGNYWQFPKIMELETENGFRSVFNFHAREGGLLSPARWLMNPSYRLNGVQADALIAEFERKGFEVGLHPGFEAWENRRLIARQRELLEKWSSA